MTQPSSKQRILFICHDGQPYGAQNSLWVLLQTLSTQPNIECIVSLAKSGPFEEKLKSLSNVKVLHHKRLQWIKHKPLNGIEKVMLTCVLVFSACLRIPALIKTIQNHNITLVHTNSMVSLEGALAAKLSGIPHLWHIRELILAFNPKFTPILGQRLTLLLINALSTQIIAISKAVEHQLSTQIPSHKINLIYNAVSPLAQAAQAKTLPNPQAMRIGYVGRLTPTKGFSTVLNAFIAFHQQHPNSTLHCAGMFMDPLYEQEVQQIISAHQLQHHVVLNGFLTQLDHFYQSIDVLVFPSTHDSFGRSIIEAMQHGVVCIAANANALPEIITPNSNGFLYHPNNALAEIESYLTQIAQNPSIYHQCSQQALNTIESTFTAAVMGEQVLALYHHLEQTC